MAVLSITRLESRFVVRRFKQQLFYDGHHKRRIYKKGHTHTEEEYDTLCEKRHTIPAVLLLTFLSVPFQE